MALYDLNQITVFINVVEQKGVRAAAEKLEMAQSSVSRAVAALETRLGTRLFERSTRAFRVTEEGRRYYERCRTALDGIEEADTLLRSRRDELAGILRISAPVLLGKYLLSEVVGSFLMNHPKAHVAAEMSDRIVDMVAEGIDLCVRFGPPPSDSSVVSRVIALPAGGLYASAAYLREHGVPRTPEDLKGHRMLSLGPLDHKPQLSLHRNGTNVTLPLTPIVHTNDIPTLINAATQGCGICMAPHFVCYQERLPETLLQVLPEWDLEPVEVRASYPSRHSMTPLLRVFIDLMAERAPKALNIDPHRRS